MKQVYFTLGAVIRNRQHDVKEWLTFHHLVGVERFAIVLHRCEDSTRAKIEELPFQDKIHVHEITNDEQYVQMGVYRWIAGEYGPWTNWLTYLDSDEYLFGTKTDDFRRILADYEEHDGLFAHWMEYGHDQRIVRPKGLTIESYLHRADDDAWINRSGKSIIKPSGLEDMLSPHFFRTKRGTVHEDHAPLDLRHYWYTERHSHDICRVNHYRYGSMEDWVARAYRGNCNDGNTDYVPSFLDLFEKGSHTFEDKSACRFAPAIHRELGDEL